VGLFKKRNEVNASSPADWQADPQEALRRARVAVVAGGTYIDQSGNRRKLTPEMNASMLRGLDAAADAVASPPATDLPLWPSGIARFSDDILEVTTGEGLRVAARDVLEIAVKPPRAGRLSLTLKYRAGLDTPKRSWWVQSEHEAALRRLVETVSAAA
jgi:hypothetical protein